MLRFLPGLLLSIVTLGAQADTIGFELGGGYWDASFSGDVITDVSIDSELGIDSSSATYFYAHLEHPIPFFPNLRVAHTNIDESARGVLTGSFNFEGSSFTSGQSIASSVDLSHTDVTLYYELIDLGMDLDLGVTARYIEGEVSLDSVSESAEIILPMLYLRGKLNLPFTGTYVGGQINATSYSGDSVMDADVKVGWQTENFIFPEFGVEAGYRSFSIDADESVLIDLEADGIFVNMTAHF